MTISARAGDSTAQYGMAAPDRDLDRTISHLLNTAEVNCGHLDVHLSAAQANQGDPALLAHHLRHSLEHVRSVSSHLVKLRDAVSRRLPDVARELDDLDRAIPGQRSSVNDEVPRAALDMSIAHDLAEAQGAAAHTDRHLSEAQLAQAAGNRASVRFNIEHAVHHVAEIAHNLDELDADLTRRLPPAGRENDRLRAAAGLEPEPLPARSAPWAVRAAAEADYDIAEHGPRPA